MSSTTAAQAPSRQIAAVERRVGRGQGDGEGHGLIRIAQCCLAARASMSFLLAAVLRQALTPQQLGYPVSSQSESTRHFPSPITISGATLADAAGAAEAEVGALTAGAIVGAPAAEAEGEGGRARGLSIRVPAGELVD